MVAATIRLDKTREISARKGPHPVTFANFAADRKKIPPSPGQKRAQFCAVLWLNLFITNDICVFYFARGGYSGPRSSAESIAGSQAPDIKGARPRSSPHLGHHRRAV